MIPAVCRIAYLGVVVSKLGVYPRCHVELPSLRCPYGLQRKGDFQRSRDRKRAEPPVAQAIYLLSV